MIRIALDERDFRTLVAGRVVSFQHRGTGQPVEIILNDIGWDRMMATIIEARTAKEGEEPR